MSNQGQTIRRAQHGEENPFFPHTRAVAQNKELSYEALGMLTYFLSKPGNWEVKVPDLVRKGCKRGRVYTLLTELSDAGHCKLAARYKDKNGRWAWTPYEIYECPQPPPCIEIRDMENQDTIHIKESQIKESVASDVLIIALGHDASTFKRVLKAAGGLTNYNARMRTFWQVAARYFDLEQRYPDWQAADIEWQMEQEDKQEMQRRAGIEHQTQGANTAAATAVIEMQKAVKDVIGFSEGAGLDFVKMFMDTCKKTSTFKDHAIPGGITAQELRDWYAYYQAVQAAVKPAGQLRVPSTLHRYITTWIEAGKPLVNAPKPINAMSGIRLLNGKSS